MKSTRRLTDDDPIGPSEQRRRRIAQVRHAPEEVARLVAGIHERVRRDSVHLKSGNFDVIAPSDLDRLFALYDDAFFQGLLQSMLREDGAYPVLMRLSRRLTRSAGLTSQRIFRDVDPPTVQYEIAVSTTLLFGNFRGPDREVVSTGQVCRDRLEALQRTFEHELLHLVEFLGWGESNCSGPTFQTLSERTFAHSSAHHDLVTPRERAAVSFGIRVGDPVEFDFRGRRLVGVANRVTRRVTVLVADPAGDLFSDGQRYLRYYVPMEMVRKRPGN